MTHTKQYHRDRSTTSQIWQWNFPQYIQQFMRGIPWDETDIPYRAVMKAIPYHLYKLQNDLKLKIKIYCDTGASIKFLKEHYGFCEFFQYPYDSPDRPKNKKMSLAKPSNLRLKYAHSTWKESTFIWNECVGSDLYSQITNIIGKSNETDILHVDSAYKSGCLVFLTSDKRDIWSKRADLERLCTFKIFNANDAKQHEEILQYIKILRCKFDI